MLMGLILCSVLLCDTRMTWFFQSEQAQMQSLGTKLSHSRPGVGGGEWVFLKWEKMEAVWGSSRRLSHAPPQTSFRDGYYVS